MYFPLTKTHPASQYWGIDLSSYTYGSNTITPTPSGPPITGIVDTATLGVFALYFTLAGTLIYSHAEQQLTFRMTFFTHTGRQSQEPSGMRR